MLNHYVDAAHITTPENTRDHLAIARHISQLPYGQAEKWSQRDPSFQWLNASLHSRLGWATSPLTLPFLLARTE
jgi:hypothetical protein